MLFTAAVLMIVVALPIIQMSKSAYHRRQSRLEQALLMYSSKQEMEEMEELIMQCRKKGLQVQRGKKQGSGDFEGQRRGSSVGSMSQFTETSAPQSGLQIDYMKRGSSSRTTLDQYQYADDGAEQQALLQPLLEEGSEPPNRHEADGAVRVTLTDNLQECEESSGFRGEEAEEEEEERKEEEEVAAARPARPAPAAAPAAVADRPEVNAAGRDSIESLAGADHKQTQTEERKPSLLSKITYKNAVIMAVNIFSRLRMVEVAYMYTADANQEYASKLSDEAKFLPMLTWNAWLCKWGRLALPASDAAKA